MISIVAYVFCADLHCPSCIEQTFRDIDPEPDLPMTWGAEAVLHRAARRMGIDMDDEASYDSDSFPKVVLTGALDGDEHCGTCLEPLG